MKSILINRKIVLSQIKKVSLFNFIIIFLKIFNILYKYLLVLIYFNIYLILKAIK